MSQQSGPAAERCPAPTCARSWREKGHAVDNGRRASRAWRGLRDGALKRTPFLDQALADLAVALEQDEGQKLGGKSAEASRFILRAIDRALDEA